MEVFVDSVGPSLAISLLASLGKVENLKVTVATPEVRQSSTFQKVCTDKKLPVVVVNGSAAATGLLDSANHLLGKHSLVIGTNDKDKKEIEKWIKFIEGDLVQSMDHKEKWGGRLQKLQKDILMDVFFLGDSVTLVDLALYVVLHPSVKGWSVAERNTYCNVVRWFDFMQHQPGMNVLPGFETIVIDKNQEETVSAAPVKAQKAPAAASGESKQAPAPAATEKKAPANKKEAQPKQPKVKQAPPPKKELPVDVSRLDIRVGKIVNIKRHPDADSLYVEEIDVGEASPRTVVSGLVNFIPIEELQNLDVVVLCNLKPISLKGVKSHAMVLAASNADHTQVELLIPPSGSKVGERVFFDGFVGDADTPFVNPKQKVWEAVQPEFATTENCIATYKGTPFKTSAGDVKVKSIQKGTIK